MKEKILQLSKKYGLSHIGSNLTAVEIIQEIFKIKKPDEKFILSNGHAGLALYVNLYPNDEEILPIRENIHANKEWCDCSTGSLGHTGIGIGMALADRDKNVWLLTSDGEMAEGSCWESLRIKSELKLDNLKWYINCNGWASYQAVDIDLLEKRVHAFCPDVVIRRTSIDSDILKQYPQLKDLGGHYSKI